MRDALLTTLLVATGVPALMHPWLGVLIWAWLDYMSPHILCYGFAASIPWVQIIAGVTAISFVVSSEPKFPPITVETVLLLIFLIWMTFTTFFAINQQDTWDAWSQAMKIQVFIVAVLSVMRTPARLDALVWVIAASVGYYGVRGGVGSLLSGGAYKIFGPDNTFIADNNDLALALVTILPLVRYLQLRTESRLVRLGLGTVMGLSVLSVLTSYSRAGMLSLAAVAVGLVLRSRRKLLFGCAFGLMLILSVKSMPHQWLERMSTIQNYEEDGSANQRLNSAAAAWNLAQDRPIVGGGFRAFTPELYAKYGPVPDYHEAHNIFLKILAEHGFPGLILFLALGFCTWRSATWVRRASRGDPSAVWAGDLVSMIQVSLLGYAVGGAFSNLAYFDLPYNLMAIVVLCKVCVKERVAEAERVEYAESAASDLQWAQ